MEEIVETEVLEDIIEEVKPKKKKTKVVEPKVVEDPVVLPEDVLDIPEEPKPEVKSSEGTKCECWKPGIRIVINRFGKHKVCVNCGLKK